MTIMNIDINKKATHKVIDHIDSIGMEGVYEGSLFGCQKFIAEQGTIFGLEIIEI